MGPKLKIIYICKYTNAFIRVHKKSRFKKYILVKMGHFWTKLNATTVVASTAKSLKYHSFSVQF